MKTKTSQRGLTLVSLTTVLLLALYPANSLIADKSAVSQAAVPAMEKFNDGRHEFAFDNDAPRAASAKGTPVTNLPFSPLCPAPTVRVGNVCVLKFNATLNHPLVLSSGMTLNCRGHKLTPRIATPIISPPQVGIFLNGVRNVRIKRCVIDGFDFGVFAINSKLAPGDTGKSFVMTKSIINSRYTGVSLMKVDNAEVIGNSISYNRAGGRALYIGRDSDSNEILKNTFDANLIAGADTRAFRVPGRESAANPAVTNPGAAVVITQIEGPEPTLLNAIIDRQIFQLTTTNNVEPNSDFSEDNRFSGNTIRFSAVPVDGIALAVPQRTRVRNNTIAGGGAVGIRVGIQNNIARVFPGHCTSKPSRLCLDNAGCNISGVDSLSTGTTADTCVELDPRRVAWISHDTRIETNAIAGPFGNGINTAGRDTTIRGNTIDGRNSAASIGIQLIGKHAIETTTVTRNSVSNVDFALRFVKSIQNLSAMSFGAKISLNDFTGYQTAVLTSGVLTPTGPPDPAAFYDLLSELSVAGSGNFWGTRLCVGLIPEKVRNSEDNSLNLGVTDHHPYNTPVAKLPFFHSPCPDIVGP